MKLPGALLKILLVVPLCGVAMSFAESILIKNTLIETMTAQGRLDDTDLLIVDGRISLMAKNLSAPDARIIDGRGKRVTPGVFNAFTQMGLVEISGIDQTLDFSVVHEDYSASLHVIDAFNPHSTAIPQNRIHGVTRVLVAPEAPESLFAGVAAIVNLSGSIQDSVEVRSVGVVVNYNEHGQEKIGGSRAAALAAIRHALLDAREYAQNKQIYLGGEGRELSLSFADLEALVPVINKQQYLIVLVERSSDILQILSLAESMDIKVILKGAQEGWMVARQIAEAQTPVIIDPIFNLPTQFETLGSRLENAQILDSAGVVLLFTGMGWQGTHNAYLVTQSAGNAVANGLPYASALKAIFRNPAVVFDLDPPGQIVPGEIADLVLWSGDPLELLREAEFVMVDGQRVSMTSRATLLRDRYYERLRDEMVELR